VNPDDVSKKSLKVLDKKLQNLAEHADFHVNINSVVAASCNPQDALDIGKRALAWDSLRPSASSMTAAANCSAHRRREARLPRDEGDGEE